jgi:ubiquinone/menaquinone biosynthesis C-methylase UbiE
MLTNTSNRDIDDVQTLSARYIDQLYRLVSPFYSLYVCVGSLGAFPASYRRAAVTLELRPGDTVYDLCCGTGLMMPHLSAAVGPRGCIIGVDRSFAMLQQAEKLLRRREISGVKLIQSDLMQFRPDRPMNAAIICIALSCIPDCETVLRNVIGLLRPGGRIVVVDSFINHGRWYFPLTNLFNRMKGALIRARPDNKIRPLMRELLDAYAETPVRLGAYTFITGVRKVA